MLIQHLLCALVGVTGNRQGDKRALKEINRNEVEEWGKGWTGKAWAEVTAESQPRTEQKSIADAAGAV